MKARAALVVIALLLPSFSFSQLAKVERVYATGPPASLLVFAIAADKLTGWTLGK